jgi:hypothetical protein
VDWFLVGLFQFIEVVYAQLFSIDVYGKVFELFVDLLVLQFLGKETVFLRVFDLIDLYQFLLFLCLVDFDGNAIDFFLILLHLYDLVDFLPLLLLAAFEVQIEVAFCFLVSV